MPLLTVDDVELFYEDTGGDGPAVVLSHSWATSGRVWTHQVGALGADLRVITYDHRGAGRSGRPAAGYDIERFTADLLGLVEALGLERPVVAGQSLGGVLALEAALAAPGRVAGAVCVDAPWHAATLATQAIDAFVAGLRADRPRTVAAVVGTWFGPQASPAVVDWFVRQILDASPFADGLQTAATTYDPRPRLPGLETPVLVVHGRDDGPVPLAVARECAALLPAGELLVVEDCGHNPHVEQAGAVNALLRAFVEQVTPRAPA